MALHGRFTDSRFEIGQLSGRAGRGTVTGRGSVDLSAAAGFPIDVRLVFDRAQLARSDSIGATVTGEVEITKGHGQPALLRGDLQLPEARRSEEHKTEPQSLMRISNAVFCLNNKNTNTNYKYK